MNDDNSDVLNDNKYPTEEENVLLRGKLSGFKRIGPQSQSQKKSVKMFKCEVCDNKFTTNHHLEEHMKTIHTNDGDWRCDDCPYQTNTSDSLKKHIDITHHTSHQIPRTKTTSSPVNQIKCNFCDEKFATTSDMINHRKTSHKTFKPCRNLLNCQYQDKCLYNHNKVDENTLICYACGEQFKTFNDLMVHRKKTHDPIQCLKFSKNACNFADDKCWYMHKNGGNVENLIEMKEPDQFSKQPAAKLPVFRDPPVNLAPPSTQATPTQATWAKMMSMMADLKQMMEKIKQFQ